MATPSAIVHEENKLPSFLTSSNIDMKPYPIDENVFDPTITSSPSMSTYKHD
jgi:hypothetical protein